MNLVIFGATGRIGSHLIEQALELGHTVTAFVRDSSRITNSNENLHIVEGDVFDLKSVENAVRSQDAVICVLGDGRKGKVRAAGTRNIVKAMEKTGTRRLICQSTAGVGDSARNLNFFWKYIMFGLLLRAAFADHVRQESIVKESDIEWTIIRPVAFTDGERTGNYRHGFGPDAKDLTLKISCPDVAEFILKQLKDDTYLRKTPALSY
ncbi:MAG: SDR family oxidoreductase [Pyrinomonadaceae bacterium]|nr:SDR family oxidoreductase [Pyrinomonadaceae bacterium]